MASFNRKETTLNALSHLMQASESGGFEIQVIVADASSPDFTVEAIVGQFPGVTVVRVPMDYFWAQAMQVASSIAMEDPNWDFILWLNDDVRLEPWSISAMLKLALGARETVIVGAVGDVSSGLVAYGGYGKPSLTRPLNFPRLALASGEEPIECHTFNGNVVLVPRGVYSNLGGFPKGFGHGLADLEFGLLVRKRYRSWLFPEIVGNCPENSDAPSWTNASIPPTVRWRLLNSPKGLPVIHWIPFCFRHGGVFGLPSALKPWLRVLFSYLTWAIRLRS